MEKFECPKCFKKTNIEWAVGELEREISCIHCARTDFITDPETGVLLYAKQFGGIILAVKGQGVN